MIVFHHLSPLARVPSSRPTDIRLRVCLPTFLWFAFLAGCATVPDPVVSEPIVLDGFTDEWTDTAALVSDPVGDALGSTDVVSLTGKRQGEHVYLHLRIAEAGNLHKPDDTGGLRIRIAGTEDSITLDTGQRVAEWNGVPVPWSRIDYAGLPTHAATDFEIRTVAPAGKLMIDISGSDQLQRALVLEGKPGRTTPREIDVGRGTIPLRVMVWNVLRGGPFEDSERYADGRRIIEVLDPDVLLIQEVWDIPRLEQKVRRLCGPDWSAHEVGGVAVASRMPITRLNLDPPYPLDDRRRPVGGDSWSVMRNLFVGVDTPVGPLVVVTAHWKCCGSMGSTEDIQRMDDALTVLKSIWRLRNADPSAEDQRFHSFNRNRHRAQVPRRFTNAPLMIAGDYNLVGSREPLDMLLTQGLTELVPLQSDEWLATTWRSPEDEINHSPNGPWQPGGFPPGRLDYALVDPRLRIFRAFVADLGGPTLISDHLPIVIDIGGTN